MSRNRQTAIAFLVIAAVAGLAYLPLVSKFGYSHDDWYLMYATKAYGSQAFHAIFSIDRPLRAYVMIPAYALFGENPLWYGLSAFFFRCLGGFAFWWLLKLLWPKVGRAALAAALLFVVYPGFLSQPNSIDYQSHIIALFLALFSLALTVRAVLAERMSDRLLSIGAAILSGLAYLGLFEYFIGFELIRFILLGLIAARNRLEWRSRLKQLAGWMPFLLVSGLFLAWRLFYFVGERKATDINEQILPFLSDPIQTSVGWLTALSAGAWNVFFNAWMVPLRQLFPLLDPWQILLGGLLGLLAAGAGLLALERLSDGSRLGRWEAPALGLFSLAAGLIPVVIANRQVTFPHYSRYALISSTGAVLLWAALIFSLPRKWMQSALFSVLLGVAVLTHFSNSVKHAQETASMNAFWWQVSWRIPQLNGNTTLVAHYPIVSPEEDYFIWGPANLIYYPEKAHPGPIQPVINAAIPNDETMQRVLEQVRQVYYTRRTIVTYPNYRNILILTQPTSDSCVQVIDGAQPELSSFETPRFINMAPYSELEHLLVEDTLHQPPAVVFGAEPPHGWCYHYEKASLARQKGDWEEVLRLADEAQAGGFVPHDQIEWMPFLQAYALEGDLEQLSALAGEVTDPGVRQQACRILTGLEGVPAGTRAGIQPLFCGN